MKAMNMTLAALWPARAVVNPRFGGEIYLTRLGSLVSQGIEPFRQFLKKEAPEALADFDAFVPTLRGSRLDVTVEYWGQSGWAGVLSECSVRVGSGFGLARQQTLVETSRDDYAAAEVVFSRRRWWTPLGWAQGHLPLSRSKPAAIWKQLSSLLSQKTRVLHAVTAS